MQRVFLIHEEAHEPRKWRNLHFASIGRAVRIGTTENGCRPNCDVGATALENVAIGANRVPFLSHESVCFATSEIEYY